MKNVQISEELFTRLCTYFLADKNDILNERIIKDMLTDKLDKMAKREEYTKKLNKK
mgnify:FL=1